MSSSLALVLASALLHAAWNLCIKRHPDPNAGMTAIAAISGLFGIGFTLAESARGQGPAFAGPAAILLALLCGLSESAYFLALGRALRDASLGLSYVVVRGGGVLLVWPLAFAVQREVPTVLQLGAIALMIAGLAALVPPGASSTSRAGYRWALTAAFFVATNHVIYKAAITAGGQPWAVFGVAMLVATPATVFLMGGAAAAPALSLALPGGQFERIRRAWSAAPVLLVAAGLMSGLSFGLALHAMRTSGAAWVGTLRNASVALAPVLGWVFLGERPTGRTLTGFALVSAAVVLLAL